MRTKIISGFPGIGKTEFYKKHSDTCLDSDSSNFSWSIDEVNVKIRNPNFPQNYIDHLKENIGKYEWILVSSHKEVRDALLDNCIFFYLVYPSNSLKYVYLERYKNRGDNGTFIKLISDNWDNWINEIYSIPNGCKHIQLIKDNYLEKVLTEY